MRRGWGWTFLELAWWAVWILGVALMVLCVVMVVVLWR